MKDDLFLKKMKGVKPLKNGENTTNRNKSFPLKKTIKPKTDEENVIHESDVKTKKKHSKFDLLFGDINKDLKRGKIKIDRRLDLHGYSLDEAYLRFKKEVIKTYNQNKRCLLIITGKGVHKKLEDSNEIEPKLFYGKIKNSITSWIKEEDLKKYILTYQDAGFEHGGDGAIFVYLRKK